jgi:hypothetical protein
MKRCIFVLLLINVMFNCTSKKELRNCNSESGYLSLKASIYSLIDAVMKNDTARFKAMIIDEETAVNYVDKSYSSGDGKDFEINRIKGLYHYYESRHQNLDTLFRKLKSGLDVYGINIVRIDSSIVTDSLYKRAILYIGLSRSPNSQSPFRINSCLFLNNRWYFTPSFFLFRVDFLSYKELLVVADSPYLKTPCKDSTGKEVICDTIMIGSNARRIGNTTFIYNNDTLQSEYALSDKMIFLMAPRSRASN